MEIEAFATAISFLRNAIGLAKEANDLVAESPKKKAAEAALEQAERHFRIAEAKAAEDMGYHLCECTFPPQIALLKPDGSKRCPACGRDTNEDYGTHGAWGG